MMEGNYLSELLAVSHRQALEFFFGELREIVSRNIPSDDILYPASILALYSQVSCTGEGDVSCPGDLRDLVDKYLLRQEAQAYPTNSHEWWESAGSQCLLFSGFFERQMRRRHNIEWFAQNGRAFFERAANLTQSKNRRKTYKRMSDEFGMWQGAYSELSRDLAGRRFVIHL